MTINHINDYCLNFIVNISFVAAIKEVLHVQLINNVIDLFAMAIMVAISRLLSDYLTRIYKKAVRKVYKLLIKMRKKDV